MRHPDNTHYAALEALDSECDNKNCKKDHKWKQKYSHFFRLFGKKTLGPVPKGSGWAKEAKNIDLFMEWIAQGRLTLAYQVSNIDKIVLDDAALKRFTDGNQKLEDALYEKAKFDAMSGAANQTSKIIRKSIEDLTAHLPNAPNKFMKELAADKNKMAPFTDCLKEFEKFVEDIKVLRP